MKKKSRSIVEKAKTPLPSGLAERAVLVWHLLHTTEFRGIIKEIAAERHVSGVGVPATRRRR